MKTLGATIPLRNADDCDFCWRETINSVLPICQEVVVAESDSTDGTKALLEEWAAREPKLKICHYPYKNPVGDRNYIHDWINFTREHLHTDYNLQMDADEVLDERAHGQIVRLIQGPTVALTVKRLNFWIDHRHLIPSGHCCASEVIRVAPSSLWLPSDSPHPNGSQVMRIATRHFEIKIFHYGFIRRRDAFFRKERGLQTAMCGEYDPRLLEAETTNDNWMTRKGICDWAHLVEEYHGPHPQVAHRWLQERGYNV